MLNIGIPSLVDTKEIENKIEENSEKIEELAKKIGGGNEGSMKSIFRGESESIEGYVEGVR